MGKIIRRKTTLSEVSLNKKISEVIDNDTEQENLDSSSNNDSSNRKLTALEAARAARKAKRDSGEADVRRNPEEVWLDDPTSLRKSINAKCYQCNGDENYRNRARYCIIFTCALWPNRPYGKGISKEQCTAYRED